MIAPMDGKELAERALTMLNQRQMRELALHQKIEVIEVALALLRVELQRPALDLQRRQVMLQLGALQPELLAPPLLKDEVA